MIFGSSGTLRDAFLMSIRDAMDSDPRIVLLTADFGSPVVDGIRSRHPERFVNVGIAEQNLINVAMGLACEGMTVFAYAIAPFLSMRGFEQIRTNLSLHSSHKRLNVNMLSVGSGISYDISGPSHHCLEDIALMRLLPGIMLYSPSECSQVRWMFQECLRTPSPKYFRIDSKVLAPIPPAASEADYANGFREIAQGKEILIAATGYSVHCARKAAESLSKDGISIGVLDIFRIKPASEEQLCAVFSRYRHVVVLEEGFTGAGGLDSLVGNIILDHHLSCRMHRLGFSRYMFEPGGREYLHSLAGSGVPNIVDLVHSLVK